MGPADEESSPFPRPGLPGMAVDVFEREGAWLEDALLRLLLERAELALDACERWDLVGDTDRFASLPFVRTFRRKAPNKPSEAQLALAGKPSAK